MKKHYAFLSWLCSRIKWSMISKVHHSKIAFSTIIEIETKSSKRQNWINSSVSNKYASKAPDKRSLDTSVNVQRMPFEWVAWLWLLKTKRITINKLKISLLINISTNWSDAECESQVLRDFAKVVPKTGKITSLKHLSGTKDYRGLTVASSLMEHNLQKYTKLRHLKIIKTIHNDHKWRLFQFSQNYRKLSC